jgi:AraC-like DNA-binding protein
MKIVQADRSYTFRRGDVILFPRNQLLKVTKYPVDGKPYTSASIYFSRELLQKYYSTHHPAPARHHQAPASPHPTPAVYPAPPAHGTPQIRHFDKHPLLESLFNSLLPYFSLSAELPADIASVKVEEAISILRSIDKGTDDILGHFEEPGKIDLADFMEKNYMFNMPMEKFGYLTGRSLSTFKRDFKKAFNTTPQKWLTHKRLGLAHYLIVEKNKKPSDVFFEAGFENLSHFSFAFKKQFGYNPTSLITDPLNKTTLNF